MTADGKSIILHSTNRVHLHDNSVTFKKRDTSSNEIYSHKHGHLFLMNDIVILASGKSTDLEKYVVEVVKLDEITIDCMKFLLRRVTGLASAPAPTRCIDGPEGISEYPLDPQKISTTESTLPLVSAGSSPLSSDIRIEEGIENSEQNQRNLRMFVYEDIYQKKFMNENHLNFVGTDPNGNQFVYSVLTEPVMTGSYSALRTSKWVGNCLTF